MPLSFRHIVSGEARGILASTSRLLLRGCSWFYGTGVRLRNLAFDRGLRRVHRVDAGVISVGNVTAGGTGKTPVVGWLVRLLQERNAKPAIVSRGYRSLETGSNDEKLVLDGLCPDVPHVQNRDRVLAAGKAIAVGAGTIVLDDGFQHRRLHRDLDIVLIDATCPFGYGALLPRGLLREDLSGLRRADVVLLTRADRIDDDERRDIVEKIRRYTDVPCIEIAFPPVALVNSNGQRLGLDELRNGRAAAFCGIGNPAGFRGTLAAAGIDIGDDLFFEFPDHHHYTSAELDDVGRAAGSAGAASIYVTQKDLVKIARPHLAEVGLWAVEIGVEPKSDIGPLLSALQRWPPG